MQIQTVEDVRASSEFRRTKEKEKERERDIKKEKGMTDVEQRVTEKRNKRWVDRGRRRRR